MTKELQLIHLCSHIVQSNDQVNLVKMITRSTLLDYDVIDEDRTILSIDQIWAPYSSDSIITYSQGSDYSQYAHNKILWIKDGDNPTSGTNYTVEYSIMNSSQIQYPQNDCPNCFGNGWYANATNIDDGSLLATDGVSKLCQMVIKALLTTRTENGYGTTLASDIRIPIGRDTDIITRISDNVASVQDYIKKAQIELASMGIVITDDERLNSIGIDDITYDRETFTAYASLTIYNYSNQTAQIGIKI